MVKARNFKFGR